MLPTRDEHPCTTPLTTTYFHREHTRGWTFHDIGLSTRLSGRLDPCPSWHDGAPRCSVVELIFQLEVSVHLKKIRGTRERVGRVRSQGRTLRLRCTSPLEPCVQPRPHRQAARSRPAELSCDHWATPKLKLSAVSPYLFGAAIKNWNSWPAARMRSTSSWSNANPPRRSW